MMPSLVSEAQLFSDNVTKRLSHSTDNVMRFCKKHPWGKLSLPVACVRVKRQYYSSVVHLVDMLDTIVI